jgi:hypothetical protein
LTINGNGFTLDGDSKFQIFSVNSGAALDLNFLTLAHGSETGAPEEGGAILNNGTLNVTNCTFSDNRAPAESTLTVKAAPSLTASAPRSLSASARLWGTRRSPA